jgi:hypothetical protein
METPIVPVHLEPKRLVTVDYDSPLGQLLEEAGCSHLTSFFEGTGEFRCGKTGKEESFFWFFRTIRSVNYNVVAEELEEEWLPFHLPNLREVLSFSRDHQYVQKSFPFAGVCPIKKEGKDHILILTGEERNVNSHLLDLKFPAGPGAKILVVQ